MMELEKIPLRVVHHGRRRPDDRPGGVEAFARALRLVFDDVVFTWSGCRDVAALARERAFVVCDNDTVLDWPDGMAVVGFQHGVAAEKVRVTRTWTDGRLALRQRRAARRARTVWVACARWIADAFRPLHRDAPQHVVRHFVDPVQFDGVRTGSGSRLVLHDARTLHKGADRIAALAAAFPEWRFEPLACAHEDVGRRMREAAAFVHLSRYEGNSIVCNEAMAMDLPCLFTNVGLLRDRDIELDVHRVGERAIIRDPEVLLAEGGAFLASLESRRFAPRSWMLAHATPATARCAWAAVVADLARRCGRELELGTRPLPVEAG
jgi:glycosyltransferase involved in cell wall biosynthesis